MWKRSEEKRHCREVDGKLAIRSLVDATAPPMVIVGVDNRTRLVKVIPVNDSGPGNPVEIPLELIEIGEYDIVYGILSDGNQGEVEAYPAEFDFRCKIEGLVLTIEIFQYDHTMNTYECILTGGVLNSMQACVDTQEGFTSEINVFWRKSVGPSLRDSLYTIKVGETKNRGYEKYVYNCTPFEDTSKQIKELFRKLNNGNKFVWTSKQVIKGEDSYRVAFPWLRPWVLTGFSHLVDGYDSESYDKEGQMNLLFLYKQLQKVFTSDFENGIEGKYSFLNTLLKMDSFATRFSEKYSKVECNEMLRKWVAQMDGESVMTFVCDMVPLSRYKFESTKVFDEMYNSYYGLMRRLGVLKKREPCSCLTGSTAKELAVAAMFNVWYTNPVICDVTDELIEKCVSEQSTEQGVDFENLGMDEGKTDGVNTLKVSDALFDKLLDKPTGCYYADFGEDCQFYENATGCYINYCLSEKDVLYFVIIPADKVDIENPKDIDSPRTLRVETFTIPYMDGNMNYIEALKKCQSEREQQIRELDWQDRRRAKNEVGPILEAELQSLQDRQDFIKFLLGFIDKVLSGGVTMRLVTGEDCTIKAKSCGASRNSARIVSEGTPVNPQEVIQELSLPQFNKEQLYEIELGLRKNLDVGIYAKPQYNALQMKEIRLGLSSGVDVLSFAKESMNATEMKRTRLHLQQAKKEEIQQMISESLNKMDMF